MAKKSKNEIAGTVKGAKKVLENGSVRKVSVAEIPEYCSSSGIAFLLGKSVRRIQQLTQDGVISTEVQEGKGARRYKTADTIQAYMNFLEGKSRDGNAREQLVLDKLSAEVKLKESQGRLHELKTAIAAGEYVKTEDARKAVTEFMSVFKQFAVSVPGRLAGKIAAFTDNETVSIIENSLDIEIRNLLNSFVDSAVIQKQEDDSD